MTIKHSFKSVLRAVPVFLVLMMVPAGDASAWKIEPIAVSGSEGTVVQLKITMEAGDWVKPDENAKRQCDEIGIGASWVAKYSLARKNGSAEFGLSATSRDLHLAYQGVPSGDLEILWCVAGPNATANTDFNVTVHMHEDGLAEQTETASLVLSNVDLAGHETFVRSIGISIGDGSTSTNDNECSSVAINPETLRATGSISGADCDDSPRGSGYLASILTFPGTQGETVPVHAEWSGLDGYLYLQAPDGTIEAESDDYSGASDSRIEVSLKKTGTYTIWATTKNKGDTGDYEISLTDEEPVDTADWRLTSESVSPTVLARNDPLSISVVGQKNGQPTFFGAGRADVVYLLSADAVISQTDVELGSRSHCCASNFDDIWQGALDVAPGTYWAGACITNVDADPANNCTSGTQITVEGTPACNSRALACGESLAGDLGGPSCTQGPQGPDYQAERFTFTGAAGETVWLNAEWDFDGYLVLEDPFGHVVGENDNYMSPANSRIEHTLRENGTYSLWATSYQPGATGAFDVSVDCDAPAGPDLTVDAPSFPPSIVIPGRSIELSAQLHNAGDQPADSTVLHYVLSSDSRIDLSDPEIGSDGAPGLEAGSSSTRGKTLLAPVTAGAYWLGACADPVAHESAVSNNCSAGRRIDVKSQTECLSRVGTCGQSVSGQLSILDCSQSPRGTGFLAEVVEVDVEAGRSLVADANWSDFDGYLLLEDPSGNIVASNDDGDGLTHSRIEYAAENSGTHRIWATSFQRTAFGTYEIGLSCGSEAEPDLVASQVSLSASEVTVGETVSLSGIVDNHGSSVSAPGKVHFMLSPDESITTEDAILASLDLGAIDAGSSIGTEFSVNVPAAAGNFWVGICVDPVSGESLVANNCSHQGATANSSDVESAGASGKSRPQASGNTGTLLSVSAGVACSGGAMSCGERQSGSLGQEDCDQGPRGAGYSSDSHTFSGNAGDRVSLRADWTGLDGYLYLEDPTGEVAGENDDYQGPGHSRIDHVLEHSGTYRVWASGHDQGQGGTYALDLNCSAQSGPDLLPQAVELDSTTVRPGQQLSLTTEVVNQGDDPSADTRVQFLLAGSPTVSANDRVLGMSDVAPLPPGGSSLETMSMALDVAPGDYWIAACVDSDALEVETGNNCALTGPLAVEANGRPIAINPGLNDAWYNPDTTGEGFFINVFPDGNQMFLSWFTFDLERPDSDVPFALGDPGQRWLIALGTFERGVATLDVYLNQGGVFDQSQPAPAESHYGSMTVSFSDCNHGQIEFDLPAVGEQGTIPITRVATDNLEGCQARLGIVGSGANEPPAQVNIAEPENGAALDINPGLNDAWYNPSTSGQGFSVSVFPRLGSVFLSWFTYDIEPPPEEVPSQLGSPELRWLTAVGEFQDDRAELTLYRVAGGVFNSASPAREEVEYGSVTVRFDDCNSGELHYDIPSLSRQGVVPIQRIVQDTVPVCEQALLTHDEDLLVVSPRNKAVVENFCGDAAGWQFDWPDMPRASGYVVELWRNDALRPMTFAVDKSEFRFEKDTGIAVEHLGGWMWRYRPRYSGFEKAAEFTPFFTFDVASCAP